MYARSFVALDDTSGKRIAFCSLDAGMSGIILKKRVLAKPVLHQPTPLLILPPHPTPLLNERRTV